MSQRKMIAVTALVVCLAFVLRLLVVNLFVRESVSAGLAALNAAWSKSQKVAGNQKGFPAFDVYAEGQDSEENGAKESAPPVVAFVCTLLGLLFLLPVARRVFPGTRSFLPQKRYLAISILRI